MLRKKRNKPLYKQFLRLRKNIQDRLKLFKFKRQKWNKFQLYSKNQLVFHKRFKIKDQFQLTTPKMASKGNSFQKKFRNNLHERKTFSLFYGKLQRKYLKKNILRLTKAKKFRGNIKDSRYHILKFFESRLDTVLYRAKFGLSMKTASQLILHGHILVNKSIIRTKSFILKTNDSIEVAENSKSRGLVKKMLGRSNFWPIPPKQLLINYRTLHILFLYSDSFDSKFIFNHYLNINSVITNIKKH